MTEHDFQNKVRKELQTRGYLTFRVNVGKVKMSDGRYFDTGLPSGFSDLIALKDGNIYFIELKTGKNKPSTAQLNFLKQMKLNGFKGGVAWTLEDVLAILGTT
jgi:ATP-dependent exoDNAse (exonuclease V) beta subunit